MVDKDGTVLGISLALPSNHFNIMFTQRISQWYRTTYGSGKAVPVNVERLHHGWTCHRRSLAAPSYSLRRRGRAMQTKCRSTAQSTKNKDRGGELHDDVGSGRSCWMRWLIVYCHNEIDVSVWTRRDENWRELWYLFLGARIQQGSFSFHSQHFTCQVR